MWVWKCDPKLKTLTHIFIYTINVSRTTGNLLSVFSYIKMYVYFSNVNITIYVVNNDFQIIYMLI